MLISLIIPVRDDAPSLRCCLQRLSQSSCQPYECLVIDDASKDDSAEVAIEWGAIVLRNTYAQGPAACRNRGALAAKGSIFFFLDADTMLHPRGLAIVESRFALEPELDALFGSYDQFPTAPGMVSRFRNLQHCFNHRAGKRQAATFWSGCGAIRRTAFETYGGFSSVYRGPEIEDIEFGYRLHAAHRTIELDQALLVTHLKRWRLFNMVSADVLNRGIPWVLLAIRTRCLPNDLATRTSQRISLVCTMLLTINLAILAGLRLQGVHAGIGFYGDVGAGAIAAAGFLGSNVGFFRFLYQSQGLGLAAAAVPLQLLQNYCSLVSVFCGIWIYAWVELRQLLRSWRKLIGGEKHVSSG